MRRLTARLDPAAAREALRAFAASRLIVLVGISFGALLFAQGEAATSASPLYREPFDGWVLGGAFDFLFEPLVRWDATWYLNIAETGYNQAGQPDLGARPAFFPVYPLLVHVLGGFTGHGGAVVAAVAISLVSFLGALYLLHRLVTLELGADTARASIWLLAFSPVAFFFSAPYTESLFLLLGVGALYAARTDRWALAGVLAGIASGTRPTGALLFIPLVVMYLMDRDALPKWRWKRPRPSILWLALTPAGLIAFAAYLELELGNWDQWRDAQYLHGRVETRDPISALRRAGGAFLRAVQGDVAGELQFPIILESAFLAFAVIAIVGVFRLLPLAYGLYCVAILIPPVLTPAETEPLLGFPRYTLTMFPLYVWLAHVALQRRAERGLLIACSAALTVLAGAFATWQHLA